MGELSNREMLVARWTELLSDASLRNVPYKIELNAEGTIEMSPANNWHSAVQAFLAKAIGNALSEGLVFTECSVLTEIGVRVPDVAWGSQDFVNEQGGSTPFTRAPEICIEIVSPSNTKKEIEAKARAFFAAGAKEVWFAAAAEGISYLGPEGRRERSAYGISVQLPASISQR